MNQIRIILSVGLICCLGLSCLVIGNEQLFSILSWFYLASFLAAAYAVYRKRDLVLAYFRPSSIAILYVSFFFFMGAFAFKHDLVLDGAGQSSLYSNKHLSIISCYFFLSIAVTLFSQLFVQNRYRQLGSCQIRTCNQARKLPGSLKSGLVISLLIIAITPFFQIPLPGGNGSFSSTFFIFASIHISYISKLKFKNYRFCVFGFLAIILAVFFYSDRRLLFFYAFIVSFIEFYDKISFKFRPRYIILLAFLGISLFSVQITMSIHRGVGNFESNSIPEALKYVDDYLTSDWSQTMLLHNFEGPSTFFHSYNAVDYMITNGEYRLGLTFVKVLFLPIPRDIFPTKPRSMVDEYTSWIYPKYRSVGGSWVPNFYAEAFWNFGFIGGIMFLFLFFSVLDFLYFKGVKYLRSYFNIKNVFLLSSFSVLLFLFRGAGFDLYGVFVLIFFSIYLSYKFSFRLFQN